VLLRWFACEVGGIGKGIGAAMELLGNNRSAAYYASWRCNSDGSDLRKAMNLRTSASLVRRVKSLCGTQGPANRYLGLVIYDWGGKLHTH